MNIKKIGVGLFLLILNWNLFSQIDAKHATLPTIIPPSPEVSNLMRFEEVPVDNYSGKPNIAFPIYIKSLLQGVTIPISLRYNTMALRIDERSSWTGTGWTLDAGAVISRTVMNLPDDIDDNFGSRSVGIYHNGYFELPWGNYLQNLSNYDIQNFLWNSSGFGSGGIGSEGDFDNELDLYQLSLFGVTARFVIIVDNFVLKVKFLENDSNLSITINHDENYHIDSFNIMDTNGVKYLLNEKEITSMTSASESLSQRDEFSGLSGTEYTYTSAWKISSVKLNNDNVLANFQYTSVHEEFDTPSSFTINKIRSFINNGLLSINLNMSNVLGIPNPPVGGAFSEYNDRIVTQKKTVSKQYLRIETLKLNHIIFNDDTSIYFEVSGNSHPEYEQNSGVILSNIILKEHNNEIKRFVLNQSVVNNRLYLDSINELFVNNPTPQEYVFNYTNKNLPEFGNDQKDIWGYYSEEINYNNYEGIFRNTHGADLDKINSGCLESILYPTGGLKEFIFESNTFSHRGSEEFTDEEFIKYNPENWNAQIVGDIQLNNIHTGGGFLSDEYEEFNIDFSQNIYINSTYSGTENLDGNTELKILKWNENTSIFENVNLASFEISNPSSFYLENGLYRLHLFSTNQINISIIANLKFKNINNPIEKFIYGGGLRIKEIVFKDADDNSINKKINYNYEVRDDSRSNGVIDGFLTNVKEYLHHKNYSVAMPCGGDGNTLFACQVEASVNLDISEYINNVYVSLTKGNYVGYSKVVIDNHDYNNGKTIFHFDTPKENPSYSTNYGYPFFPVEDKSHLHGLLRKQEIYNDSDIIKQVDYNYYGSIETEVAESLFIYGQNECYYLNYYSTYDNYLIPFPSEGRSFLPSLLPNIDPIFYIGLNCSSGGYTPAPVYYNFVSHTFNKKLLEEKITKNYYYNSGGVPKILESKEEYQYNLTNYQLKEIKSTDSNNEIHKSKIYYVDDTLPAGIFTTQELSDYSLMSQNNMITTPIYQQQYKSGTVTNRIKKVYDEFNNLLLPKTVQTAKGEITANNPLEDRITYHNYDQYGNPTELSKVEGVHIVYIWGYNHTQPIAKIINATYAEVETILGANFVINNYFTNTQEDNLRNGLSDAQVTTMEYLPLIGVSKITDSTGNEQTFHYDEFNRLQFVKDSQGNILSKNEYHYRN